MNPRIPLPTVSDKDEKRNNRVQIHDSKITYWFIPPEIGALSIPLLKKNILGVVATFTRAGGECWATDTQLGEAFQWSRQKVNAAINEMVTAGLLRKDVTRLANGMTPRRLWIADSFPTLSPTVTTLATSHIDLVTHGDYPCHLEGLPLSPTVTTLVTHGDTNSNKLNKEKVTERVVADAPLPTEPELKNPLIDLEPVKEPLVTLEEPETFGVTHPPQVPPPPLPKKKKAPSRKTSFPSPEYWEAATPKLIEWAIDNGADDSAVARWVQEKIIDMEDSAAAKGYQFIDWVAAFRKWYRRDLPKGSGPEADIRKATVWLWNHTHGERMEKPPASPVVVTAVRKTLEQLGKTYLTALGETEEKWRELKLKELRQMIHDNLEAAQ